MTIQQIYDLAVIMGKQVDPRADVRNGKWEAKRKKEIAELKPKEKKEIEDNDPDSLTNPYSDTRILYGDPNVSVDKVMVGIDIDTAEVILASYLNDKKPKRTIDLIISHHPMGAAYASLHEVMDLQAEIYAKYGVPINIAEGVMHDRIQEVERDISPRNHFQAVDAAKLLNMPLMCSHTACDNLVFDYLEKLYSKNSCDTVRDVLILLEKEPEYKIAKERKFGPIIFCGDEHNRCGRVVPALITGGTEGAEAIYEKMAIAGVGTIIAMHASEEHVKKCSKYHMNMVVAGHISSDSLGVNLFLDELEQKGIEIVPVSGLIRVKRVK